MKDTQGDKAVYEQENSQLNFTTGYSCYKTFTIQYIVHHHSYYSHYFVNDKVHCNLLITKVHVANVLLFLQQSDLAIAS